MYKLNYLLKRKTICKLSWIGLNFSGKSTLIRRISKGRFDDQINQTMGLQVDEFKSSNIRFICWDIGGRETFCDTIWQTYLHGSAGICHRFCKCG